ncbi:MAG: potassium channel family protein [Pseudomonadota bacterium]
MQFTWDFINIFLFSVTLVAPLLMFFCLIIFILGQIVGRIEHWTRFNSFYWSFITAFTVGYGDIRPVTKISKVISIIIALIGIMFTGIIVAMTVAAATAAFDRNVEINFDGNVVDEKIIKHSKK